MPNIQNWNQAVSFTVSDADYKQPTRISEIQDIVKYAFQHNIPVAVAGAKHSATACMQGNGINISMNSFDRILSVDPDDSTVTVQAGVTLTQLVDHLKEIGLQPHAVLEFGNYQIGAICGTHANDTATKKEAQFSSFVLGVKLVTPTGEMMEISKLENPKFLQAIRSHFGMFGVIYEVTLRVFRTQPLLIKTLKMDVDSVLNNFSDQLQPLEAEYDQIFGMMCPYSGKIFWQCRKFIEPVTSGSWSLSNWINRLMARNRLVVLAINLIKAGTSVNCSAFRAKILCYLLIHLPFSIMRYVPYVIDPCDRGILYGEHDASFDFYDWAFPEQNWCDMTRSFLQLCSRFQKEHNFGLPLPTVVYFLKQDEASLLSRSRHSNMIALDPLYPNPGDEKWREFRLEYNKIAMLHGGIPHINKTRDGAVNCFGEAYDSDAIRVYHDLRKQMDPKDLFMNDHFREMFAHYL